MTVTAVGSLALRLEELITLVAQSATFQARCALYHPPETASEANARTHIYVYDQTHPTEFNKELRPFAVVTVDKFAMEVLCKSASVINYRPESSCAIVFVDNARFTECEGENAPDAQGDSYKDALNWIGGIIDGWNGAVMTDAAFPLKRIETIEPIARPEVAKRESDDFWYAAFLGHSHEGQGESG